MSFDTNVVFSVIFHKTLKESSLNIALVNVLGLLRLK